MNGENEAQSARMIDPRTDVRIYQLITEEWIKSFIDHFCIVSARKRKQKLGPAKQNRTEIEVAYHVRKMERAFKNNIIDEKEVENANEISFAKTWVTDKLWILQESLKLTTRMLSPVRRT